MTFDLDSEASSDVVEESFLTGLFLECVFFGMFIISFGACVKALLWRDGCFIPPKQIRWSMLCLALLFAAFAIIDPILLLFHDIAGFVTYQGPGGASRKFSHISDFYNVMDTADFTIPVVIADAILIWRCWVVYDRSYLVILVPTLIWASTASLTGYILCIQTNARKSEFLQAPQFKPILLSFSLLTLIHNILTTGLIIWRIRFVDKTNLKFGHGLQKNTALQRAMRILIESGVLYTACAIFFFCTYATNSSFAFYCITDVQVEIVALAFNLIISRASCVRSDEYSWPSRSNANTPLDFRKRATSFVSSQLDSEEEDTVVIKQEQLETASIVV